jgi:hypothetical protein
MAASTRMKYRAMARREVMVRVWSIEFGVWARTRLGSRVWEWRRKANSGRVEDSMEDGVED